jgi:perosamine synthetase
VTRRPDVPAVVRLARGEDEQTFLGWRNDPWIVRQGHSQREVSAEEHHAWFLDSLEGIVRELYIAEVEGVPAGMVRYDFTSAGSAEVSIYLMPDYIGRGYGSQLVHETAPRVFASRGVDSISARARQDNLRSQEFFLRLGFSQVETDGEAGLAVLRLQRPEVPHSRPWVGEREASQVADVVRSGQIAQGPKVLELERRWSEATRNEAAVAVGSGLAALRLGLLALGVTAGDEVVIPAYSCVALCNAVLALGATPVFADVLPELWTLSADDVARRLTPRTRAIIAVHQFGVPADLESLSRFDLPVVEDCAHGIGGLSSGVPFGAGGAVSMASFYATKMLAAGEGGILAGDDPAMIERAREARDYGDRPPDGRHLNDKMTDLEAAMALVQLDRLEEMLDRRAERALDYLRLLGPLAEDGLVVLPTSVEGRIWYRFAVQLTRHDAARISRDMWSRGVHAEQPVWDLRGTRFWDGELTVTSQAFDRVLSLPLYPDLSEFEQELACSALEVCLRDGKRPA